MKDMISQFRGALVSTFVFAIILCGFYPLVVWGIGQVAFKDQANGSLILDKDGKVIGSHLLGQNFTGDSYFHPRPSSAGENGYDAASSSGSNLGPTSEKLAELVKERVRTYRAENGLLEKDSVPVDAVTASGSGLDPHISPFNASLQIPRVARARGISEEKLRELMMRATDRSNFGILGDAGVNVLELNLALDRLK